ncbi:MAG: ABC transporter permease [Oscillospiraceae bacterium]|nr:ABC transporter permease [Oscillospiraceae bacterium]
MIKRIGAAILQLFVVMTLIFFMVRIIPGDPATQILGEDARIEDIEMLREQMGLNDPIPVQYVKYLKDVVRGDWGESLYNNKPVFENIRSRMEPTILLTVYSVSLAVLIGVPMGIIAAKKRNSLADYTLTFFSAVGMSAPGFWVGLMMVFYLGVQLRLFPTQGYTYIADGGLGGALYSLTMPAVAYALSHVSSLARYTRTMMLDVISNDYVRTARAKGLKERIVYYKHALKNALAPVVTNIGFSIATLLGGATVAETVFNINGMGRLAYDSLMRRDYTQQQANLLFTTILLLATNILLDIVYKMLDPRIEFD